MIVCFSKKNITAEQIWVSALFTYYTGGGGGGGGLFFLLSW